MFVREKEGQKLEQRNVERERERILERERGVLFYFYFSSTTVILTSGARCPVVPLLFGVLNPINPCMPLIIHV